ncbi:hypothetical protein CSC81_04700 [Tenacibaculum discolor]|uniref:Integral membrane protein (PIN domain superfamily) n=1 Tax=Tenacibaculum discolor TaxID=361581 RepID=A0A2G1BVU3_9FLAO|nr:hypothetical protein [Tenacibaculum discolor]MDP2542716.1 hypothetical protein [Tenacibaculum discolor]PHN97715.1 hypothetical protein CSC81_04700 [Tenacibaculum discolor]PHO00632.1 hypothetical protein CSC82_27805 [Rhodobacteraceae bacterium 4F10]
MDISVFLLKFWGWYCIIFFFILSFNPKRVKQIIDNLQDARFLIILSLFAILIGLLNVLAHNIWEANIKLLVTLFGWLALIKGIILFTFPKQTISLLKQTNLKFIQAIYVLLFFLGLFLLNEAYGIVPF